MKHRSSEHRYSEKLYQKMVQLRMTQKQLHEASGVSDSEVSRILNNKSQPGLENAHKLARALGISLDYLADDVLDADPARPAEPLASGEQEVLELAQGLGIRQARRLLETASDLGYEVAIRRLLGAEMKPLVEVGDGHRPTVSPANRANSA